jgi:hypothetical protein
MSSDQSNSALTAQTIADTCIPLYEKVPSALHVNCTKHDPPIPLMHVGSPTLLTCNRILRENVSRQQDKQFALVSVEFFAMLPVYAYAILRFL